MSTKMRSAVVMSTPPAKSRSKAIAGPSYTVEAKQQLLDNFDLEIADKLRSFRSNLSLAIQSFMVCKESEILRIPRELRGMTLNELTEKWDGSFSGTVRRLQRDKLEKIEKERREIEEAAKLEAEAKGKRKRDTPDASPERNPKNARHGENSKQLSTVKNPKRKGVNSRKNEQNIVPSSDGKPPSSLPQNHTFNPLLPKTPKLPRPAKRGESFFLSVNGSPIQFTAKKQTQTHTGMSQIVDSRTQEDESNSELEESEQVEDHYNETERDDTEEEEGDSDGDLPDVEAYEAKLQSLSQSQPQSILTKSTRVDSKTKPDSNTNTNSRSKSKSPPSKPSKKKRAPSLIFRKSLAPQSSLHNDSGGHEIEDDDDQTSRHVSITLNDGTVISFNPFEGDRIRIEEELAASGLSSNDIKIARDLIMKESVKALQTRMDGWQIRDTL